MSKKPGNINMSKIEYVATKELKPYEKNPRRISVEEFENLKVDLEEDKDFFHDRPLLVNRSGGVLTVYAGNQRLQAAKKLGWKEVPCIIRDDLDEETLRRRIIKDNKHRGEWDYDILANEFEVENLIKWGFSEKELLGLIEDGQEIITEEDDEESEDGLPCPACGKVTKPSRK